MATILVVDDSPGDRQTLVAMLRSSGHHLLEAANGLRALSVARTEQPDLVIVDLVMSKAASYDFVRRFRSDPALAHIVILLSAAVPWDSEVQSFARVWGVFGILGKPMDENKVLDKVTAALSLPRPRVPFINREWFDLEHRRWLTDLLSQKVNALEAVNRRLTGTIHFGRELTREQDPMRLLEKFCQTARELVGARYAAVGVMDEDRRALRHFVTHGLNREDTAALRSAPPEGSIFGKLSAGNHPVRLSEIQGGTEFLGLPTSHPPVTSFIGVPFGEGGPAQGWLYLIDKPGAEEFTAEDEWLLVALAEQAAAAYKHVKWDARGQPRRAGATQQPHQSQERQTVLWAGEVRSNFDVEGVHIIGPEGNSLQINSAGLVTGDEETGEPFRGDPVYLLGAKDLQEKFRALAGNTFRGEQGRLEFETMTREGTRRWFETHSVPLRNDCKETVAVMRVTYDISDRKREEKALKMQAQMLDALPESVSAFDQKGILFYTNSSFDALFGYECGEMIGKHLAALVDGAPQENVTFINALMGKLNAEGASTGDFYNRKKDGTCFTSRARIAAAKISGKNCWVCVQEMKNACSQGKAISG